MRIERAKTGVAGLDEILGGGLPTAGSYLLLGQPGTGKTTIGIQFLMEGAQRGEKCLYVCMAETRRDLQVVVSSFGWSLDGITVHEMRRRGRSLSDADSARYTVFNPAEIELEEISTELLEQIERFQPTRLVVDSLAELRILSNDPYRYRRELLHLSDQISGRRCTSWLIDVLSRPGEATVAETLVSGVVHLEHLSPAYGGDRRRLQVRKLRASVSLGGYHDFVIKERGVEVYPRLVSRTHRAAHSSAAVPSGVKELDALLGGGLDYGTSTVLSGAAGTGKSTVAAQFVAAAASRGERGAIFCFDESPSNLMIRTKGVGIPLAQQVESGMVQITPIEPAEYTPGELSHRIRKQVEDGARVVVIDSANGYVDALPEERFLSAHLRGLLAFLAERGVATILTLTQHGLLLAGSTATINISHVADTVIAFRYFESSGEVKHAISVMKKRTGDHERTIRPLSFGPAGLHIGPPLTKVPGVFAYAPPYAETGSVGGEDAQAP